MLMVLQYRTTVLSSDDFSRPSLTRFRLGFQNKER
jgi:hypothetical protein